MPEINEVFIEGKKTLIHFMPNRNAYRCKLAKGATIHAIKMKKEFQIQTIEGIMKGNKGDWLVQNPAGELYPMTHPTFIRAYEKKEE